MKKKKEGHVTDNGQQGKNSTVGRVIRKGLSEQVMFEPGSTFQEGPTQAKFWSQNVPGRSNSKAKVLS